MNFLWAGLFVRGFCIAGGRGLCKLKIWLKFESLVFTI